MHSDHKKEKLQLKDFVEPFPSTPCKILIDANKDKKYLIRSNKWNRDEQNRNDPTKYELFKVMIGRIEGLYTSSRVMLPTS